MNRQTTTLLKLAVGILLIAVLFWFIDEPEKLLQEIVNADKRLLVLGTCSYTAAVAIGGLKWGKLLQASNIHFSWGRLLSYQWVAEFFNNFLPTQAGGDVVRGYAVATDTQRAGAAAASVLVDRFIGLGVFVIGAALASMAMLLFGHPSGQSFGAVERFNIRWIAIGSSAVSIALVVAVLFMLSDRLRPWIQRLLAALPLSAKTVPIWESLSVAFNDYRQHSRALLLVTLGSISIVLLTSINIWLIANAIQPDSITLFDVIAINPIIVFILLVFPILPGGIFIRQVTFAVAFALLGYSEALGTGVGILQQAIGYLVSLPGGLLWIRGRSQLPESSTSAASEQRSTAV